MAKGGLGRSGPHGLLLAAVFVSGCGCFARESVCVSHAPGAPRPKVVAVLPFCPDAGDRDRLVAAEACENGVRAAGVEVVARERVEAAMAEHVPLV